jgi:long-chain acyl-CoA synthetase
MSTILVTGATGLLGRPVLAKLLQHDPRTRIAVLVRDRERWRASAAARLDCSRVTPVVGDLLESGLGISAAAWDELRCGLTGIVHLAADTQFSRPLAEARAANTDGTRRMLELANDCVAPVRFAYVSTAFVAGRNTGTMVEGDNGSAAGWVNAYEQSKYEAEELVRESGFDWVILRPSTIVCDGPTGEVSQHNAVHRALRTYYRGLAAMMPGVDGSTVDVVTTDYVSDAIVRMAMDPLLTARTFHLCAGDGALSLDTLLDDTYARWAGDINWRRRGISRPATADLDTYALFERTIESTGDRTLQRLTRALSHFVPQLALPKRFDTSGTDAVLGYAAPRVADYWMAMIDHLLATDWGAVATAKAA